MRVLCLDSNHPVLHETLTGAGFQCDLFWDRPTEELKQIATGYEALVIRSRFRITREFLQQCKKLRCIGRVGAGMENIDVHAASELGIVCLCVPEGNRDAVGEHALGMLLMLLNHLKRADTQVRRGEWIRADNRGTEIKGKTVGIIGYGQMGSAFAKKLSGFECRIIAHDKYRKNFSDNTVREVDLEEIYRDSDIVSIHLPLTEETRHYANKEFFNAFKKPVYFINTARGGCMNSAHLVDAMEKGIVMGACLDVQEFESVSFEQIDISHPSVQYFIQSERVVLSPHIAGWTHESNYKMSLGIAEKMIAALRKGKPRS